ncbi:MAG TPA: VWA domain-containing protein [Thermoanaerobaculia bacterium]
MKLLSLCGLVALGLLVSQSADAQAPGPVRERAEVSLVEVPVRIVDREGKPVRGLAEKDFTLYDDGRKQTIVGFDAIDLAEKVSVGTEPPPPAARRRFLILFDFSFARPKAVLAARRAAKEFVLSGMGDRDLTAVATYSVEKGVQLLVTFSSDRVQLASAIDTLGIEIQRELGDPLAFAFDTTHLTAVEGRVGGRAEAQAAGLIDYLQTLSALTKARADEYARGRVRHLIQSFSDLGQALDAVEGRKDVIYLSEGFSNRYLVGTRESDLERQWLIEGEQWKVDADKRFGNTPLRTELRTMGELLRRTDCVIHAVDIAGIRTDSDTEAETATVGPRETENSLYEIVSGTGGEVFRNTNDMHAQLGRLISQTSLVYVLAFRPDRGGKEGKFHELKVKVSVPGARVSARAGYYERKGFKQLSPLERSLSAADVIANEIPVEDIPARVLATPFATGDISSSVPVILEIPGERFLAGGRGDRATIEIYVYANDQDNRLGDFFVQAIGIDLAKNGEKLRAGGLKYYGELRLPPGNYRLRTLVRNADTGRMGLTVSALHVPNFQAHQPYLLPPVFLENSGEWLLVRGRGKGETGVIASSGYPFLELSGESFSPAALPQVQPGRASRVCLVAYHFGAHEASDTTLRVGNQILTSDGQPLKEGSLSVLGKSMPGADGKRMLLLSFTTPQGLAPGRYGLRIFLQDTATGQARQASAPFLVP